MVTLLKLDSLARNSVPDHNGKMIDQLTAFLSINNNSKDTADIRMNSIQYENQLSGSPEWILSSPALNREVEGFMSNSSINKGQSIKLFYSVNEPNYQRMQLYHWRYFELDGIKVLVVGNYLDQLMYRRLHRKCPRFKKMDY